MHLVGLALPNIQATIQGRTTMKFRLVRAGGSKVLGGLFKAHNATIIDFTGQDAATDPLTDLLFASARVTRSGRRLRLRGVLFALNFPSNEQRMAPPQPWAVSITTNARSRPGSGQ